MTWYSCHMVLQPHKLTVARTVFCLLHSDTLGYSQSGPCTKAVNVPTLLPGASETGKCDI